MKDQLSVCLLNDSFPPAIDGVANAVMNYARVIQGGPGPGGGWGCRTIPA